MGVSVLVGIGTWVWCDRPLMDTLGLDDSGSAGLYGSGAAGPVKVGRGG